MAKTYVRTQEYALYKGDNLLAIGNAMELSILFNVKPKTIQYWSTPAAIERAENSKHKNSTIAIKLNENENRGKSYNAKNFKYIK